MKRVIVLTILLLMFGTTVLAQPSTAERVSFAAGATSATVSGTVDGTGSRAYVLYAFAGQRMDLTLNAASLTLVSPSGIPLVRGTVTADPVHAYNDILPETGDYTILVSIPSGTGATNYNLTISITGDAIRKTDAERISFQPGMTGAVVNGWVSQSSSDKYLLYAFAGQNMEIALDLLSASITLISPTGTVLIDHGTVDTDFVQVFNQTLPQTGDYTIQVHESGTALLPYTLDVSVDALPGETDDVQRISFAPGAISATVTGALNPSGTASYVLRAFAGQQMSITLNAATLTVVSPSGVPLVRGTVTAEPVRNFSQTLPETGDYRIVVSLAPTQAATNYSLTTTVTGAIIRHEETERISFAPGAVSAILTGTITDAAMDNYVLYAFAGQSMTVTVEGAYLTVVSPSGSPLARAQAGATTMTTTLPETGDYRVSVSNPSGTGTLNYTLTVSITG